MTYYPLSQVTCNLFTNGGEFVFLSNNTPYSGYYWKTSDGKFFTGKTPQSLPNEEIIKYIENQEDTTNYISTDNNYSYYNNFNTSTNIYITLTSPPPPPLVPLYIPNIPNAEDYNNGEFNRYFCKKNNELIYIEINLETYDKLKSKNSQILYQLYSPFLIPWKLTGIKEQVYKTNKNMTELISYQSKLPKLSEYIGDFVKYYKS